MAWLRLLTPDDDTPPDAQHRAACARTRELVASLRANDADAFRTIYLTYYHRLWEFGYSLVQSDTLAEDVVHDIFAALWYRRATLQIESTIDAYLFGAIRHRALNVLRQARTADRVLPAVRGIIPGMGSSTDTPESATTTDELDTALHRAIAALPPGQQQAILLYWRHGLSNPEIARVMETSTATVAVHLSRAREALRRVADRYLNP